MNDVWENVQFRVVYSNIPLNPINDFAGTSAASQSDKIILTANLVA